jgi:hypothetical protein
MRSAARRLLSCGGVLALLVLILGVEAASASASPPSAPQNVTASPATSQALVSWSAPSSNGGSPITGYTITPYIGSSAQATTTAAASASSATLTGLSNGTSYTFTVKATNSAGTSPESSPSASITPQDTIFDFSGTPQQIDSGDTTPVELGVKFKADSDGTVTGIRFYKASANTGTHTGSLWSASGTLLASATFTGESASGWQTVTFSSPVAITAGTTYIAGYLAPNGHYSSTPGGLSTSVDNPPLHALANSTSANGVYAYSATSTFPTNSYNASNYWVDILYAPGSTGTTPGQPTNASASPGNASATVSWSAPSSNGGSPITGYTITPYIGSSAQTTTTVGGSTTSTTITGLTNGTSYTFTVAATNANGTGPASSPSNAVTPASGTTPPSAPQNVTASPATSQALVSWSAPSSNGGSQITGYTITPYIGSSAQTPTTAGGSSTSATITGLTNGTSYTFTVAATNGAGTGAASSASGAITPQDTIFDFSGTPQTIDSGDTTAIELGVKFKADTDGSITGIRFYKASANTGTHIGSLWTTSGQLLAQATFNGESASGWQTVTFSSPVQIAANTTYIAGYFAPNGHYSATSAGLTTSVDNPPLRALANGTGANGVYAYNGSSTFPTSSYNATNYWVDVLYAPANTSTPPGQPTNVTASALPQAASLSWSAPGTGGTATSYTITPYTGGTAQPPTTVSGSTTSTTVTGLIPDESYTFTVTASNSAGAGPASTPSNAVTPTPATAPTAPQSVTASPATNQALVSWSAPASNGGSQITGYTITPYIGSTAQTTTHISGGSASSATVTGLTNGTSYTFTVKASNSAGTGPESAPSPAITPGFTVFDFSGTPQIVDSGDTSSIELGVKFTADVNGSVTGIRFYKASANTGTHIGSLWTTGGQLLAQATFTNETASGWQTVTFSSPVAITAGTTYIAGYLAPAGHYSATSAGLTASVDNAPLHAVANGASANGVYAYNGTSTFPTNSYNATNYWVDVLFATSSTNSVPGQPSNVSAAPAYGSATVNWTVPWDGGSPITGYTITPFVGSAAQSPTTVAGNANSATISGLTNGTSYTFTVAATNANGTGQGSTASNAVTPGPQPQGQWSSLINWPLVAVHSTLMANGKVLVWDAWQQPAPTQEFDPSTLTFTNPINSPDGIFCSAMAQMPDGRILVVGGYGELSTGNLGIVDTNIYDPGTSSWTRVADMHHPRWYPGFTELADGRYVVISGKSTDFGTWADTPEVYDPSSNTWTLLSNVSTSQIHELEYPNTYLLPSGNVFVLGPQEDKSFELDVNNQTWTQVGGASGVVNGASVMYRPGKVLYAGGASSLGQPSNAQANAAVIDLTAPSPAWQSIAPMAHPRAFNTLQMLADGTVLGVGGEPVTGQQNGQGEVSGGVLPAEIWDPNTQQWTTAASMAATRGYHASTLLLPDGRVLVAGSGHAAPGEPGQYSGQFYSPPYLFKGARPTITSAPSSATYSSNITVSTPDAASIRSVNLVDLGTSTHQMDFSQHFVPLGFTAGSGALTVQTPASGAWAPPGNYMVFIVNSNGVPSIASIINLSSSGQPPAAPQAPSATALNATSARVSWTVPGHTSRPVTRYTVTPYLGSRGLTPTSVTGSPAPTSVRVSGLRSGASYRFKVRASNASGTGPPSRPSNAVMPTATTAPHFVQKASAYSDTTANLKLEMGSPVTSGDRLIVVASIWGRGAGATGVSNSAGDHFTELLRGVAADGTETSVWTAPVRAGGSGRQAVTVSASGVADLGAIAVEYAGLSSAPGASAIDRIAAAGGTTRGAATVDSGRTQPTTAPGELALGIYADSGFGDLVRAGRRYTERAAITRTRTMMEQVVEDRVVALGATPDASARTGAQTPWTMATLVFRTAAFHAATGGGRLRAIFARRLPRLPRPPGAPTAAAAIPLSRRPRPHPAAGAIAEFVGRLPDGRIVHYYCLIGPGGRELSGPRAAGVESWTLNAPPLP